MRNAKHDDRVQKGDAISTWRLFSHFLNISSVLILKLALSLTMASHTLPIINTGALGLNMHPLCACTHPESTYHHP